MPQPLSAASRLPEPPAAYRWTVLLFLSLAMAGNYYIYDSIAPVADLLTSQLGYTDTQIGWLYSIYSVSAITTLLVGGILVDRLGVRVAGLVFALLCLAGALINVSSGSYTVMLAGRLVLGLGAESLIVAVTTALAKWFKGKELGFAFGVNLLVARLASVAADNSPTWAQALYDTWRGPLALAVVAGAIGVLGAAVYWGLESRAQAAYSLGEAGQPDKLVVADLFRFTRSYWFVVGLCLVFYSAVFPFRTFAIKFFIEGHGATRELGGFLNSVLPMSAMVATPLFGLMVDRLGRRALFMLAGSALLVPAFVLLVPGLGLTPTLYLPIALLGIAFSLVPAVMWPSVTYVVEQHRLGTAYALMTLVQQVGVMAMNWAIGAANDAAGASQANPAGYAPGMWLFSLLGFLGIVFAVLLRRAETGPGAHGLETIRVGDARS
jgi:MFS family permease